MKTGRCKASDLARALNECIAEKGDRDVFMTLLDNGVGNLLYSFHQLPIPVLATLKLLDWYPGCSEALSKALSQVILDAEAGKYPAEGVGGEDGGDEKDAEEDAKRAANINQVINRLRQLPR